jgi:hypothetical protein
MDTGASAEDRVRQPTARVVEERAGDSSIPPSTRELYVPHGALKLMVKISLPAYRGLCCAE